MSFDHDHNRHRRDYEHEWVSTLERRKGRNLHRCRLGRIGRRHRRTTRNEDDETAATHQPTLRTSPGNSVRRTRDSLGARCGSLTINHACIHVLHWTEDGVQWVALCVGISKWDCYDTAYGPMHGAATTSHIGLSNAFSTKYEPRPHPCGYNPHAVPPLSFRIPLFLQVVPQTQYDVSFALCTHYHLRSPLPISVNPNHGNHEA